MVNQPPTNNPQLTQLAGLALAGHELAMAQGRGGGVGVLSSGYQAAGAPFAHPATHQQQQPVNVNPSVAAHAPASSQQALLTATSVLLRLQQQTQAAQQPISVPVAAPVQAQQQQLPQQLLLALTKLQQSISQVQQHTVPAQPQGLQQQPQSQQQQQPLLSVARPSPGYGGGAAQLPLTNTQLVAGQIENTTAAAYTNNVGKPRLLAESVPAPVVQEEVSLKRPALQKASPQQPSSQYHQKPPSAASKQLRGAAAAAQRSVEKRQVQIQNQPQQSQRPRDRKAQDKQENAVARVSEAVCLPKCMIIDLCNDSSSSSQAAHAKGTKQKRQGKQKPSSPYSSESESTFSSTGSRRKQNQRTTPRKPHPQQQKDLQSTPWQHEMMRKRLSVASYKVNANPSTSYARFIPTVPL